MSFEANSTVSGCKSQTFFVVHEENEIGQIFDEFRQLFKVFGVFGNASDVVGHVDVVDLLFHMRIRYGLLLNCSTMLDACQKGIGLL